MKQESNTGIRTVLAVLRELSQSASPVSFTCLISACNTNGPTLSRLLKFMADEDWTVKTKEGYLPGAALSTLAKSLLKVTPAAELLQPVVKNLSAITGESAGYVEFHEDGFIFKAKHEAPSSYHYIDLFQKNPNLFENGFGKFLLSHQPKEVIEYILTKAGKKKLIPEYLKMGKESFLILKESCCVRYIASVFGHNRFYGAIGVSSLFSEIPPEREKLLTNSVVDAATEASRLLAQREEAAPVILPGL